MAEIDVHSIHSATAVADAAGQRPLSRSLLDSVALRAVEVATVLVMLVEVAVVATAVFFRYILNRPIGGSDEIATLLLVWMTYLGGAVALQRRLHPSVVLVFERLPVSVRGPTMALTRLVEVVFFTAVTWHSLAMFQLRQGSPSAGAGFDMSLYPLALMIGVGATLLLAIGQLANLPKRDLLAGALALLAIAGAILLAIQGGALRPAQINPPLLIVGGFALLLLLNAPLAVALGFPSLLYLQILGGPNLLVLPQRLISGADNFVLLAIPLFILAGLLMETGGISRRLVDLAVAL